MKRLILLACLICLPCFASAYRVRGTMTDSQGETIHHGTCAAYDKGLALTAKHVIDKCILVQIEIDGEWETAEVVVADTNLDLALLKCPELKIFTKLAKEDVKKDDLISMIGSKKGQLLTMSAGRVEDTWFQGQIVFKASINFDHGDSGSPILYKDKIVGIALAGIANKKEADGMDKKTGLFAPITIIQWFLTNNDKQ